MSDFASTALLNLVVSELSRQGVDLPNSPRFEGKLAGATKTTLLDQALGCVGPLGILRVGEGIRRVAFDPTLNVLLRARGPEDLLERWQRLESYYHGKNRVRLDSQAASAFSLVHYASVGVAPTLGEDLLIAGLIAALLESIGVCQLSLSLSGVSVIVDGSWLNKAYENDRAEVWQFSWKSFEQALSQERELRVDESLPALLTRLIQNDLGRDWTLGRLAPQIGLSTRSLQRRLNEAGTRFQTVLRVARAEGAAKLLLADGYSLAQVGYAAGYADQAHFSREFKLRFNVSPGEFLALDR